MSKESQLMKPNLLLLIIDSFRADKFYGNSKTSKTPNSNLLLTQGVYFEQAVSVSDATLMSWASLFTAKYPFKTGIRSARFNKLDENITTYFQILKNHDYHFYGFLPTLSETIDLFPNFENSDNLYDLNEGLYTGLGQKILGNLQSGIMKEPWFFTVHIMDLHFPIIVPKDFQSEKFGKTNYEKMVSAIDIWIGKLLKKLDLAKTLFVITADHGSYIKSVTINEKTINFEENPQTQVLTSKLSKKIPKFMHHLKDKMFFALEESRQKKKQEMIANLNLKPHEKRALLSGRADKDHFLFDDNIRIPLLFVGHNVPKNQVVSSQVSSIDILPTVCEIIGVPNPPQIDGKSLLPLVKRKPTQEIPTYIESTPLVISESNDVIGIRTSKYKYFRDKNDPKKRIHLFDLKNDLFENENIAENKPDVVIEMESILQNILKNSVVQKVTNDDESQEIENELRKLGYI